MENKPKILLVDDEKDMLDILSDFLDDEGFEVVTAENGLDALEILKKDSKFDLLLSDINMPKMKGFELIKKVRNQYNGITCALITAYDINSYIELAKTYNVSNIIPKTSPFNFEDFLIYVNELISGKIFGIEKFFKEGKDINSFKINGPKGIEHAIFKIFETLDNNDIGLKKAKIALREIIINAVYYGAKNEDGSKKENWDVNFQLKNEEEVIIKYSVDEEKLAVAIIDQKGRLKKSDVLFWLERNIVQDPKTGFVKSINDEHGRGIFMSREFSDSFIINIDPGIKTEVIIIKYLQDKYKGSKPLIINEL